MRLYKIVATNIFLTGPAFEYTLDQEYAKTRKDKHHRIETIDLDKIQEKDDKRVEKEIENRVIASGRRVAKKKK